MYWNLVLIMVQLSLTSVGIGAVFAAPTGPQKLVAGCIAVANALLATINIRAYRRAQRYTPLRVTLGTK